jgi:transaldolase
MKAVEFTTNLTGAAMITIPAEVATQLPKKGSARVIVLTGEQTDETEWRQGAYEQFLREDPPEDAIYDTLR